MRFKREHLRAENTDQIINEVGNKAGVYRIYLSQEKAINRLVNTDDSGLFYIGHAKQANGLLKRIRDFYDSASNKNKNGEPPTTHTAGRFYQLYMQAHFGKATDNLEFEFDVTEDDIKAVNKEVELLTEYLKKYGELPPLNNQLPKNI